MHILMHGLQENKAMKHELLLRETQLLKVRKRAMSGEDLDEKPIRIYIDGCFDMMHYGHSNALRQAKKLGDQLVVGVMNDAEIVLQKGPPVMNEQERYKAVRACKWVDEVIEAAPYEVTPEWTNKLLDEMDIDFIVHGDDPCITADGKDAYATAKDRGRFKMIKRTEGVSTTDIVGRMMLMSKEHHSKEDGLDGSELQEFGSVSSDFLATTSRYSKFCSGKVAKPQDKVIYVAGAFDLFHAGHIDFLDKA
jgi:ethanolamine-phosphate cytidylyltransferase